MPSSGGKVPKAPAEDFPSGLRVLLVDDDPLCLMIVEKMLRRCDYSGASIFANDTAACGAVQE